MSGYLLDLDRLLLKETLCLLQKLRVVSNFVLRILQVVGDHVWRNEFHLADCRLEFLSGLMLLPIEFNGLLWLSLIALVDFGVPVLATVSIIKLVAQNTRTLGIMTCNHFGCCSCIVICIAHLVDLVVGEIHVLDLASSNID